MKLLKGLHNLGNTCYLNSVIQCFIYDPLFKGILNDIKLPENCNLILLLKDLVNTNKPEYNIIEIIKEIIKQKPFFEGFSQNDSHEFYIHLIDILSNFNEQSNEQTKDYLTLPDRLFEDFLKRNNSPLTPVYHGQTRTCISCIVCNNLTKVYEEYNSINLHVPQTKVIKVTDLFRNYLETERQDDQNNLYQCDSCNLKQVTHKQISLWRIPPRLTLVLKKYSDNNTINYKTVIEFPLEPIKIKETSSGDILRYQLTGVIYHKGSFNYGHYYSKVLVDGHWYHLDDQFVKSIETMKNTSRSVYMLFFNKVTS